MGYMYSLAADAGQLFARAVEPSSIGESHDASGLLGFFEALQMGSAGVWSLEGKC